MHFFFLTFLLAFTLGNAYVMTRGWQMLEAAGRLRWLYTGVMSLLSLLFLAGMLLKRAHNSPLTDALWYFGSWWLAVMLYSVLALVGFDLVRLGLLVCGKRLSLLLPCYPEIKLLLFSLFVTVLLAVLSFGYYNATRPGVTEQQLTVAKPGSHRKTLHIVAVSDLHLGAVYSRHSLQRWVNRINTLRPDIIFLVGDTFDDHPTSVIRNNLGAVFAQLQAPMGVYAVTGNHERMGRAGTAMQYLSQHGVQPLLDEAVLVDSAFYVVGRLDRSADSRQPVSALLDSLDHSKPIIVLDHQPNEPHQSADAGADLYLSGHTHHGQLWPLNFLTGRLFQKDWGVLKIGATHCYTSCGLGTWGAPVRTAGHSEIVSIQLQMTD